MQEPRVESEVSTGWPLAQGMSSVLGLQGVSVKPHLDEVAQVEENRQA